MDSRQVFRPQPGWEDDPPPRRRRALIAAVATTVGLLLLGVPGLVVLLSPDDAPSQASPPAAARRDTSRPPPGTLAAAPGVPTSPDQISQKLTGPVADAIPDTECVQYRTEPATFGCLRDSGTTTLSWTGTADQPENLLLTVSVKNGTYRWEDAVDGLAPVWGQDTSDRLRELGMTTATQAVSTEWGDFVVRPGSQTLAVLEGYRKGSDRVRVEPAPSEITQDVVTQAAEARGWSCTPAGSRTECLKGELYLDVQDAGAVSLFIDGPGADAPDTYDLLAALPSPGPEAARALQGLPEDRKATALEGWFLYRRDRLVYLTQGDS